MRTALEWAVWIAVGVAAVAAAVVGDLLYRRIVRDRPCGCPAADLHGCAAAADGRLDELRDRVDGHDVWCGRPGSSCCAESNEGRRTIPISALPPVDHDPDAELAEMVDRFDGDGLDRLYRAVAAVQDDPGLTPDGLATLVDAVDRHVAKERGEVDGG